MKISIRLVSSMLWLSLLFLGCSQDEDSQSSSDTILQETEASAPVETTTPSSDSTTTDTSSTDTSVDTSAESTTPDTSSTENASTTATETTEIESVTSSETTEIAPSEGESSTENTESSPATESEAEIGNDAPQGPIVWEGPTLTFSKADGADPGAEANQDRLTSGVWITRGNGGGQIYNAAVSSSADKTDSPLGTEWAVGGIANKDILTFQNFRAAVNNKPKDMVGTNMVVHLIEEDIYLSIRFTSWSQGQKGGFTYERSTP